MTKLKKLFTKLVPSTKSKFKNFEKVPIKSLGKVSKRNDFTTAVTKALGKHKKILGITVAVGTTVAVTTSLIENYIASNSGCFLLSEEHSCKVKELSCCQPDPVENLPFCNLPMAQSNICNQFNEDVEKSCCRLCSCAEQQCLPGQTMECRRPTVGDGLSYIVDSLASPFGNVLSPIWNILSSWFMWIIGIGGVIIIAWLALIMFRK
jgi:hypothetical protein